MKWQQNISEGFYRIALVLSSFVSIIVFIAVLNREGLFQALFFSGIVFAVIFGIIAIINYIIRGFIG